MALESANRPIRWLQRIGTTGFWHVAKWLESQFFDEFVYGTVNIWAIAKFGVELGASMTFFILAPISAAICLFYLYLYDRTKKDLFSFESVKEIRDTAVELGRWESILRRIIQWGDFPAFIVLNCFWPNGDPFMATVYLRKASEKFSGLTRRDWDIFWASVLVGNAYWTVRWTFVVVLVSQFLWPTFIRPTMQWFGLT